MNQPGGGGGGGDEDEDDSRMTIQRSVSFDRRAWARVEARSLDGGGGGSLSVVRYDPSSLEAGVQQLPLYDRFRSWFSGTGQPANQPTYSQLPIVSKVFRFLPSIPSLFLSLSR